MPTALVTNATQYAGPGAVPALLRWGFAVLCHDRSFAEPAGRGRYEAEFAGVTCLSAQTPDGIAQEVEERAVVLDAAVSNDAHPISPRRSRMCPSATSGRPSRRPWCSPSGSPNSSCRR